MSHKSEECCLTHILKETKEEREMYREIMPGTPTSCKLHSHRRKIHRTTISLEI
jgi:hypothetical protein